MAEPMNIDLAAAAAAAAAGTAEASSAVADTRILAEPEQQHAAASSTAPAAIESAATTEASGAAAAETETGKVIYRLKLGGFPNKGASQAVVMALVSNLKLNPIAVFKKPVYTTATVTFATPEERDHAISVLNGRTFQNSALVAEVTSDFVERVSTSDRGAKRQGKRAAEEPAGDNPEKRVRAASPEAIRIMLNDNVTPYWQKPYEEQLALKQADMLSVVKKYSSTMTAKHGKNDNWSPKEDGSLFCEMQPIRASPVLTEYRNKCEFSIGMGHDGSRNMVGFLLGAFKNGFFSLAPVDECLHVSPIAKRVASAMQTFLNTESKADGYDKVTHEGFWRQILVRDSTLGELLAVVQYAPFADSAATQTELDKLHQYFLKLKQDRTLPLTTLMTQAIPAGQSYTQDPVVPMFGEPFVHEQLLGLKFRVSHAAFFQVNQPGAEVLFSLVRDWCSVSNNTVLVDICCGTGTIGQLMARQVSRVIGIEMVPEAIEDAKRNAELNGLDNTEYICSRAEDAMRDVIGKLPEGDVVGVVDPPRAGLHPKVVQAIRGCARINKLVYVSCNPAMASENWIQFTAPPYGKFQGPPFRITRIAPVDMFPQTEHTELVLLMER